MNPPPPRLVRLGAGGYGAGEQRALPPGFLAILGPDARLYAARCPIELNQHAEAYEELSATIRDATERAPSEPRSAATRDAASTERTTLAAKIGLVVIAVTDRPAGLVVTIAGRVVPPERLGGAFPVTPGPRPRRGLGGLAAGALMILFGGAHEAPPVAITASPDGARLRLHGQF